MMKSFLGALTVILGFTSMTSANCSSWKEDETSVCLYGDSHDGVPWNRSCDMNSVCHIVGHHPYPGVTCSVEGVCLPRNLAADSLGDGCAPWEEATSVDARQACDGQTVKLWTRVNECASMGVGYATRFCSATMPEDKPLPSSYTQTYFDPDDFTNDPNLPHN